jgi:hypothetical protein
MEIKAVCKYDSNLANKLLFDLHYSQSNNNNDDDCPKRKSSKLMKFDSDIKAPSQLSNLTSTSTSSWSSLRSTTNKSSDSSESSLTSSDHRPEDEINDNEQFFSKNHSTREIRVLIESEFVFCLNSLNAFSKTGCDKTVNPKKMYNFIVKNDHLHRILTYLVKLFESFSQKLSSWQIYYYLQRMKFQNEKIQNNFNRHTNTPELDLPNNYFKSKEYINLRIACSTEEFRKQLKDAYVKYLIEKLCTKSKRTRAAVYWMFNRLRRIKYYLLNKLDTSPFYKKRASRANNINEDKYSSTAQLFFLPPSTSLFEIKLLSYYHLNKLGIPFIPYALGM